MKVQWITAIRWQEVLVRGLKSEKAGTFGFAKGKQARPLQVLG